MPPTASIQHPTNLVALALAIDARPAATMNTIGAPPQIRRISGPKRAFGIVLGLSAALGANLALGYSVTALYSRNTTFVPYDVSSDDLATPLVRKHNPLQNPPGCIDHAVKTVPYSKLPRKYWTPVQDQSTHGAVKVTVDQAALTRDFCRGVWSGLAFRVQRRYLERKYRALEGREGQLWDVKALEKSEYPVGTVVTDHFEVVEHTPGRITVRCGDSPLTQAQRPSDGLFAMEVSTDDAAQAATFHLKSVFTNTTPEGKDTQPLPENFQFAHRWYTKLWMESATRKLIKDA